MNLEQLFINLADIGVMFKFQKDTEQKFRGK